MAFGTGSRSFGPDTTLYSFKIKTKDLPAPVFEVSKKVGDNYEKLKETATRVSGNIISAVHKENTHEGKEIKSLSLTFQDLKEVYFVSVGYTFLGRNAFNSLLALKTFDDVEIGLYQSKPKPDAVNRTGFASVATRQAGELVRGLYEREQLPATKKVRVNGKDQTDTEALDLFFEEKLKAWCKVVNAASKKAEKAQEPAGEEQQHEGGDANSDEENVPF